MSSCRGRHIFQQRCDFDAATGIFEPQRLTASILFICAPACHCDGSRSSPVAQTRAKETDTGDAEDTS